MALSVEAARTTNAEVPGETFVGDSVHSEKTSSAAFRCVLCLTTSIAIAGCAKTEKAVVDTSKPSAAPAAAPTAQTSNGTAPDTMPLVRGTVASISATELVVKSDSGSTTIKLTAPLTVYSRGAATLAAVKPNTFIGVTTVKQPDSTEKATEIHIFPDALRGLGEGSRMMTGPSTGNRMTNGSVGDSRMTNGTASGAGSTMVVNYAGGSQTVTVPSNVSVTEIKAITKTLAAGDQIIVPATRNADGSLSTDKVLLSNPPK